MGTKFNLNKIRGSTRKHLSHLRLQETWIPYDYKKRGSSHSYVKHKVTDSFIHIPHI